MGEQQVLVACEVCVVAQQAQSKHKQRVRTSHKYMEMCWGTYMAAR